MRRLDRAQWKANHPKAIGGSIDNPTSILPTYQAWGMELNSHVVCCKRGLRERIASVDLSEWLSNPLQINSEPYRSQRNCLRQFEPLAGRVKRRLSLHSCPVIRWPTIIQPRAGHHPPCTEVHRLVLFLSRVDPNASMSSQSH